MSLEKITQPEKIEKGGISSDAGARAHKPLLDRMRAVLKGTTVEHVQLGREAARFSKLQGNERRAALGKIQEFIQQDVDNGFEVCKNLVVKSKFFWIGSDEIPSLLKLVAEYKPAEVLSLLEKEAGNSLPAAVESILTPGNAEVLMNELRQRQGKFIEAALAKNQIKIDQFRAEHAIEIGDAEGFCETVEAAKYQIPHDKPEWKKLSDRMLQELLEAQDPARAVKQLDTLLNIDFVRREHRSQDGFERPDAIAKALDAVSTEQLLEMKDKVHGYAKDALREEWAVRMVKTDPAAVFALLDAEMGVGATAYGGFVDFNKEALFGVLRAVAQNPHVDQLIAERLTPKGAAVVTHPLAMIAMRRPELAATAMGRDAGPLSNDIGIGKSAIQLFKRACSRQPEHTFDFFEKMRANILTMYWSFENSKGVFGILARADRRRAVQIAEDAPGYAAIVTSLSGAECALALEDIYNKSGTQFTWNELINQSPAEVMRGIAGALPHLSESMRSSFFEEEFNRGSRVSPNHEHSIFELWQAAPADSPERALLDSELRRRHADSAEKLLALMTDGRIQTAQSAFGLEHVRTFFNNDYRDVVRQEALRSAQNDPAKLAKILQQGGGFQGFGGFASGFSEGTKSSKEMFAKQDRLTIAAAVAREVKRLSAEKGISVATSSGALGALAEAINVSALTDDPHGKIHVLELCKDEGLSQVKQLTYQPTVEAVFVNCLLGKKMPSDYIKKIENPDFQKTFIEMNSETQVKILNSVFFYDYKRFESTIDIFGSRGVQKLFDRLPWMRSLAAVELWIDNSALLRSISELAESGATDADIYAYLYVRLWENDFGKKLVIQNLGTVSIAELAESLDKQGASWGVFATLEKKSFDDFKGPMVDSVRREALTSVKPGSKLFADMVERAASSSAENYAVAEPHLKWVYSKLAMLEAWVVHRRLDETRKHNAYGCVEVALTACESISNKNLRKRLEERVFELEAHGEMDAAQLQGLPKDMHATSTIFASLFSERPGMRGETWVNHWTYDYDQLKKTGDTLFTGQVFKKRTDLDRFNYFVADVIKLDTPTNARSFFEHAVTLMQEVPEAKKRFFAITQQLKNYAHLQPDIQKRLGQVGADFKNLFASTIGAEREKQESVWRSEIEGKISESRAQLATVDATTEEGQKALKKLQQKIAQQEKKLAAGFTQPKVTEASAKEVVAGFDRIIEALDRELVEAFTEKSGLTLGRAEIVTLLEKYKQPGDLFTYLGKLKEAAQESLSDKQVELYKTYMDAVARGHFPAVRYTHRVHLDKVFKGRPHDEAKWRSPLSSKVESFVEAESGKSAKGRMQHFVQEAVQHGHIEGDLRDFMRTYVETPSGERKRVLDELEDAIKSPESSKARAQAARQALVIAKILGQTSDQIKNSETVLEDLESIKKEFASDHPFVNDIDAIKGVVESLKKTKGETGESTVVYVEETEDPDMMLRAGTDVSGSCQNINGAPRLNQNLVTYMMDGKSKMLVVRDENKTILGRSILRVLYDEVQQQPVLVLERVYHREGALAGSNEKMLYNAAQERARVMGYPLLLDQKLSTASASALPLYDGEPQSYGGPGAMEYVDSLTGSQPDQKYQYLRGKLFQVPADMNF